MELRNGLPVRHLRSLATGEVTADEFGDPMGDGFEGVVEAWIAVDGGYLAGVRAVGSYSGFAFDDEPSPEAEPYRLELTIEGANDKANRVDEPVAPDPTVLPSADPGILALLDGIDDGLAALDTFVAALSSGEAGTDMTITITVVNRPVASMLMETGSIAGMDGFSTLVIGDRSWSREGDGPWSADDAGGGMGGLCEDGANGVSCAVGGIVGLDQLAATAGTFVIVDPAEVVDGVQTTHLRSTSGMPSVGISIPGTTDLWVANEGGHLVRYAFAGQGITMTLDVTRINDPTIVLAPPADASPTPEA